MAPMAYRSNSWNKEADANDELAQPVGLQPTTRKVSPKRIVLGSLMCLAGLAMLQKPMTHCYRKVEHMCHRPRTFEERAHKILTESPLIDTHIDFAMLVRAAYNNKIHNKDFIEAFENGTLQGDLDLKRLREGQSGGAFWSVWTPCPKDGQDFAEDTYYPIIRKTLDQIDVMSRIQSMYPDDFSHSKGLHSKDAMKVFKEGKFISPYGIEGLHQIGNSAAVLRDYFDMGVRYATLTHNCNNFYADASQEEYPLRKATPMWDGVSDKGKAIVDEMNRIGMIVDLSHVSAKTMKDVLAGKDGWKGSRAPVMFSHSSVYSLCPHPRNVPDDILELVKETNSVVNINIGHLFLACEDVGAKDGLPVRIPGEGTLSKVVEHIMYIGEFIGYDHVGIGTDLDGIPDQPEGFEDVSKYPDVIAELLRRGVSDQDAAKVAGLNSIRVWAAAEKVAVEMQAEGFPILEDEVTYDGPY